ncbi:SufS subfamily cysteine desulfurase [Besnoitia besnoiti]|uniref:cysteine desulfurase n=1 Tax=Besnoitia besnoiti TaxID=94643 RepID=A0A2A9MCF5_BESBE|nr:SufS subfamily cysteine desulfurase [Besnoitia besnoiti]PFH34904.1 SufS subfamily cysteine desulfurase [Besnoitia besnoiti]
MVGRVSTHQRPARIDSRPRLQSSSAVRTLAVDWKAEFPFQSQADNRGRVCGNGTTPNELIYFDSAATSQKPRHVIDVRERASLFGPPVLRLRYQAMEHAYVHFNANVHRAAYARSAAATERMEGVRAHLARFLNAERPEEIIFTSGATEAINLVANTWGEAHISEGDEILLTVAEHHSNLVPWQLLAARKNAHLKFVELDQDYRLSFSSLASMLSARTKVVALSHTSNVLGSFNPHIELVTEFIKRYNPDIAILIDATQALAHQPVDVRAVNCDFLVGSGHKMYGPTGVGFLYGKHEILQRMPPWKGGGEMIEYVDLQQSTYAEPPARFEAGTPPFLQVMGLGAALEFIESVGWDEIASREDRLRLALHDVLSRFPDLRLFCPPPGIPCRPASLSDFSENLFPRHRLPVLPGQSGRRCTAIGGTALVPKGPVTGNAPLSSSDSRSSAVIPLISFSHPEVHAHDIAMLLDVCGGVCVRSGHHCCQPLHRHVLRVPSTCRVSLALYNSEKEIERFGDVLATAFERLGRPASQKLVSGHIETSASE